MWRTAAGSDMVMTQFRELCLTARRGHPMARLGVAGLILVSTAFSIFTLGASASTSLPKWSSPVLIGSKGSSNSQVDYSVSCPTSTFCVSVNGDGQVLYDRRGVWSSPHYLALGGSIDSVSCSSAKFCVAIASGEAAVYNGHIWSSATRMGPAGDTYRVSCPVPIFCAAVGASGVPGKPSSLMTFNGRSWSKFNTTATGSVDDRLLGVSCSNPHFCMVTNYDGQVLSFNGSRWTPSHSPAAKSLISVSCATSQFCMAVTINGEAMTFHSQKWSRLTDVPAFKSAGAYSVSCGSATECSVIGLSGAVATWISGRWSSPSTVFPGGYGAGVAISCSSGSDCVAVNDGGFSASR